MPEIKKRGRPEKEEKAGETVGTRFNPDIISRLDQVVIRESQKTGYELSRVNIIRKAVVEFLDRYESGAE